jgi:hypothetical protein
MTDGAETDAFLRLRTKPIERVAHALSAQSEGFGLRLKVMELKRLRVA